MGNHIYQLAFDPDNIWSMVVNEKTALTKILGTVEEQHISLGPKMISMDVTKEKAHLVVGDGKCIEVYEDSWIFGNPLSKLPITTNVDVIPQEVCFLFAEGLFHSKQEATNGSGQAHEL